MSTADVNDRTKLLCARCTVRPISARSKDRSARGVSLQSKSGPPGNTWRAAFLQYHYKRTTSESSSNGLVVRRIESGHRTLLISRKHVRTLLDQHLDVNDRTVLVAHPPCAGSRTDQEVRFSAPTASSTSSTWSCTWRSSSHTISVTDLRTPRGQVMAHSIETSSSDQSASRKPLSVTTQW